MTKNIKSKGYAMIQKDGKFIPFEFERHALGDHDILIKILYAGICHSDIHTAQGDWGDVEYPIVPGHEIVGIVKQVGPKVTKFEVGDYAGVGCMVNSCKSCKTCNHEREQECHACVYTYASPDQFHNGELTQGGYANNIVLSEKFALQVPSNADLTRVAPLLCAGITTYSPIQYARVRKGDQVAIAGFGGLGHMALQYLVKIGAVVTVFDVSRKKRQIALDMGAYRFVNVKEDDDFYLRHIDEFFFILSTIPSQYDISDYMKMLQFGGELAIVGVPAYDHTPTIDLNSFVFHPNRKVYGSLIGGIKETQEMLNYSIKNEIYPQVKIISGTPEEVAEQITEAYKTVVKGQVQFRFVIDMTNI